MVLGAGLTFRTMRVVGRLWRAWWCWRHSGQAPRSSNMGLPQGQTVPGMSAGARVGLAEVKMRTGVVAGISTPDAVERRW